MSFPSAITIRLTVFWQAFGLLTLLSAPTRAADLDKDVTSILQKYCFDCHGNDEAQAHVNLQKLTSSIHFSRQFKTWEKAAAALANGKMPPKDAEKPTDRERKLVVERIKRSLNQFIQANAGDPGRVVMRRMTSAEFGYAVEDLTGLKLGLQDQLLDDAVGGEGFTNVGDVQFIQDATLEQYLKAAKHVASHAVIGAGPLQFYRDPGKTGFELSAITRIQSIYRANGFRTAAGEGAEPYGLDLYPRALFVAWQFRHRKSLQQPTVSLDQLAKSEGISVRLCRHISQVVNQPTQSFPLSLIVSKWNALPDPSKATDAESAVRKSCSEIGEVLREWQGTLAAAAGDEEEAAVLTAGDVTAKATHSFLADINWADGASIAEFELSVTRASDIAPDGAVVIWKNANIRFRGEDNRRTKYKPMRDFLAAETVKRLRYGVHPAGVKIGEQDFVIRGGQSAAVKLVVPAKMAAAQLKIDVELDTKHGKNRIVRCRIADGEVEGETAAEVGETSTLLADPKSEEVEKWRASVAEFARLLPEVSHREPAPSDRDPIPAPFDNAYNKPERNHFHYAVKYHRDDRFLVQHVLDDDQRRRLDEAWTDLLMSFEYHDANLRFVAKKFGVDLDGRAITDLTPEIIDQMPSVPRKFVRRWYEEHHAMKAHSASTESRHVDQAVVFAWQAWRRPLSSGESARLRDFYHALRNDSKLDHTAALRTLIARILVTPAFLFRAERQQIVSGIVQLSDWELANRLSFFLWSSVPDRELLKLAERGELSDNDVLARQVRRMLTDKKARRLSIEFFGQWLGFYRFHKFRGVDAKRFPQFTDQLKQAVYEESISFFEHIIRNDRPVTEILFADYTFLNRPLAKHYGIPGENLPENQHVLVKNVGEHHRGGLTRLGTILTVTSAPLRTSAVKRGDWILRRVIGTPVPPPPADAGSIAPDDTSTDGLTVRKRLEIHRQNPVCAGCHARIDPLGFALEHFDVVGRWRDKHRDGQPIDSTGILADGTKIEGLDGLRRYLRREQSHFHRTLCAKLLGYALGRTELASDRPLIDNMVNDLQDDGFSELVVRIVTSKQFRHRRGTVAKESKNVQR